MGCEITVEIKTDKAQVFTILEKQGYTRIDRWMQISTYWTHLDLNTDPALDAKTRKDSPPTPIPYKTLIANSVIVRDKRGGGEDATLLIHKGKTFDTAGNVTREHQNKCNIDLGANKVFELAGFKNWVTMRAEQLIFANPKCNKSFAVQDVDGLGLYLEIEDRNNNGKTQSDLIHLAKSLGLELGNDFTGIKLPYLLYELYEHRKTPPKV